MDYVNPYELTQEVAEAGGRKTRLPFPTILVKGMLSGAFLGYATAVAYTGATQTGLDIVGALLFPVGFVLILLLNLELVTGSFAMIPMAVMRNEATVPGLLRNFCWAFLGNLLGSLLFGALFVVYLTQMGHKDIADVALAQKVIAVAQGKTLAYQAIGGDGYVVMFVKAILCNWMVTMGAVMSFSSRATIGKIVAMWIPVFIFFALGLEHAVVNMFVIPTAMMLGADIGMGDWWLWNQIPVTIGNFLGGFIFTGWALHGVTKQKK